MKKRQKDMILIISGIFISITMVSFFSTSFIMFNKRIISVQNRMVEVTKEVEKLEGNIKIIENENITLKEKNDKLEKKNILLEEKIQILEEESEILNDKVEEVVSKKQDEKDEKKKLENLNIPLNADIKKHIIKTSEKYGLDPYIMYAVISVESSFNTNAVGYNKNGTYDSGLCQINSSNRRWLLAKGYDIDNIYGNIEAGAHILSLNLKKSNGNYAKALTGYNTGKVSYENAYSGKVLQKAEVYRSI